MVLYAILAIIVLHIAEIWIFALTYHLLLLSPDAGNLSGALGLSVLDHVYFSATVFTTVGFYRLDVAFAMLVRLATKALLSAFPAAP